MFHCDLVLELFTGLVDTYRQHAALNQEFVRTFTFQARNVQVVASRSIWSLGSLRRLLVASWVWLPPKCLLVASWGAFWVPSGGVPPGHWTMDIWCMNFCMNCCMNFCMNFCVNFCVNFCANFCVKFCVKLCVKLMREVVREVCA